MTQTIEELVKGHRVAIGSSASRSRDRCHCDTAAKVMGGGGGGRASLRKAMVKGQDPASGSRPSLRAYV